MVEPVPSEVGEGYGSTRLLRQCGKLVRLKRQALGLTQEQVGAQAGLSGNTISLLEQGKAWPLMNHLIAIVETLELPWSLLLTDRPDAPSARLLTLFAVCPPPLQLALLTLMEEQAALLVLPPAEVRATPEVASA